MVNKSSQLNGEIPTDYPDLQVSNLADEARGDIRAPIKIRLSHEAGSYWLWSSALLLADSTAVALAWGIAGWLGAEAGQFGLLFDGNSQPSLLLPVCLLVLGILVASGNYDNIDNPRNFRRLAKSLSLAQVVLVLAAYLYPTSLWIPRSTFVWAWLLSILLVYTGRVLFAFCSGTLRSKHPSLQQKAFILGQPDDIETIRDLLQSPEQSHRFAVKGAAYLSVRENRDRWMNTLDEIKQRQVTDVFVSAWASIADPVTLFWELRSLGVRLRIVASDMQLPQQNCQLSTIEGVPTILVGASPIGGIKFWAKRVFDVGASLVISAIIGLPMLAIAWLIRLDSPGPIVFKQERVGLKGETFKVWKFRTMVQNASELQKELEAQNEVGGGVFFKMKDDPRITRVGKFLRKYSLDELPQLVNVLKGEMSLIGPRPLPLRDVEKMPEQFLLRHEVLPGITGLWQVSGRSDTDSEKALSLDIAYIQNWSLGLDLDILLKTVKVVLMKEGAY